jgi:hypothetical protein
MGLLVTDSHVWRVGEFADVTGPLSSRTVQLRFAIRTPQDKFPPVVVTDLRETHGITAEIHRQGAMHISIHDLGLGQCRSNIAIDGSVVRLFPFHKDKEQTLFLGPSYAITREPVERTDLEDSVFLTLGGPTADLFRSTRARPFD